MKQMLCATTVSFLKLELKNLNPSHEEIASCLSLLDNDIMLYTIAVYRIEYICFYIQRAAKLRSRHRANICPSVHLSVCPSVRLSICPSVRLPVWERFRGGFLRI